MDNQKFELVERATQSTYTLQHPLSRVMRKVNTWIDSEVWLKRPISGHKGGNNNFWENFVFATLVFAHFAYATLEFDISLLPLLSFDNISLLPFSGKSKNFRVAIVIHCPKLRAAKVK